MRKEYKISDIADINRNSINKDYSFEEIEYLDTGSITNGKIDGFQYFKLKDAPSRAKRLVSENDIIYSTVRPIQRHFGFIKNSNPNLVVSTGFAVVTAKKNLAHPKFLYYFLSSNETVKLLDMIAEASTSAYPSLRPDDIAQLDISLPTLNEQIQIAEILSSLDAKITLLQNQNSTLENLAETIFREWFIERMEDDWKVGKIEDEFDFTMGQSPLGSTLNENKVGMIFFQGITDFKFRFPVPRIYTTAPTRIAQKFDTLVSVRAPVGDMNMAMEECCLGRGVSAFRYKHNPAFYSYTYYKLRSLMQQIKQFEDTGTVFGSIGKDDFKKIENIIPPKKLVDEFQKTTKAIDDKIYLNTNQISTLERIRNEILPKLINGEVSVNL